MSGYLPFARTFAPSAEARAWAVSESSRASGLRQAFGLASSFWGPHPANTPTSANIDCLLTVEHLQVVDINSPWPKGNSTVLHHLGFRATEAAPKHAREPRTGSGSGLVRRLGLLGFASSWSASERRKHAGPALSWLGRSGGQGCNIVGLRVSGNGGLFFFDAPCGLKEPGI